MIYKNIKAGKTLKLEAGKSVDPDGNILSYQWFYYPQPGNYKGKLHFTDNQSTLLLDIPHDAQNCTLHLILRVTDNGTPALTSYRRIVVKVR